MADVTRADFLRGTLGVGVAVSLAGLPGCGESESGSSGTLRVGIPGGSTKDTLEPQFASGPSQQVRMRQLYETLTGFDHDYQLQNVLAEEITSKSPTVWIVRLKQDLLFHNGKPVEADDVMFSLKRILDTSAPRSGTVGLAALDPKQMRKLDKRTVELNLTAPTGHLPYVLGEYYNTIVPRDFDVKKPVGTGPFKFVSHNPGQESRFERFTDYWQSGKPRLEEVVVVDLVDNDARVNALLGNQVDAIANVPAGQISVIEDNDEHRLLQSPSGGWLPITLRGDQAPFTDIRVRQAVRLIADRKQLVDSALAGRGRIANDLYAPYDPDYASELPQREQDIEQAKSLLRAAGQSDLRFTITTTDAARGQVQTAEVFAQQAKAAGVTVRVQKTDPATLYGDNFGKWQSTVDIWGTRNYLPQTAVGSLPSAVFNTQHFENDRFASLYKQASAESDDARRKEINLEMQRIQHEEEPMVIAFFYDFVDAHNGKVKGLAADKGTLNLSGYDFRDVTVG